MNYPSVTIKQEMLEKAHLIRDQVKVNRTIASPIDTLTGIIGEFAFAEYFFGDWKNNNVTTNKGRMDFNGIEVKTSAYPFRDSLNLLVREDYAQKRKPDFYIQVIIDVNRKNADNIQPGTKAIIAGWATYKDIDAAPKKDFGSKYHHEEGGYKCHHIMIKTLKSMDKFKSVYQNYLKNDW